MRRDCAKNNQRKREIATYWFRVDPFQKPPRGNFGDEITALIIEILFGYKCTWAPPEKCEFVGAGSTIEILLGKKEGNRPVLWGTGFMKDEEGRETSKVSNSEFEIAALRGRYSRDRIEPSIEVPLGDPGLLANQLLHTKPRTKFMLGIIPHMIDAGIPEVEWLRAQEGIKIINAINDPNEVVRQAAECHFIASSSLHGLIIADSLQIPNAHIKLTNSLGIGGLYKFKDYYSAFASSSRYKQILTKIPPRSGNVEAIVNEIQEKYTPPGDLEQIQESLVKSFPF